MDQTCRIATGRQQSFMKFKNLFIHAPILYCFRDVGDFKHFAAVEISDSARHF